MLRDLAFYELNRIKKPATKGRVTTERHFFLPKLMMLLEADLFDFILVNTKHGAQRCMMDFICLTE